MRLFHFILDQTEGEELLGGVRYTVGEASAYFQNVKGIREFSSSRIVISAAKCDLCVTGECLVIRKYYGGDLELGGRICSVERCV